MKSIVNVKLKGLGVTNLTIILEDMLVHNSKSGLILNGNAQPFS